MDTLKTKKEFDFVYKNGLKWYCKYFIIYLYKDKTLDGFKVGLSVSRKIGNAVKRNLVKRRLRSLLQSIKEYSGFRLIIVARQGILELSFMDFKKHIFECLHLALKKIGICQNYVNKAWLQ